MGCRINGCSREPRSSRAPLCELHRTRLRQRGTTDDPPVVWSMSEQRKALATMSSPLAVQPGPCWEWSGPCNAGGYGLIGPALVREICPGTRLVHRVAFAVVNGDPGDLLVCHACDNRKCYRASHLFKGTHADNSADMVAKGRQNREPSWQRFTDAQIRQLREAVKSGITIKRAAVVAGISESYASRLINGKRRARESAPPETVGQTTVGHLNGNRRRPPSL